MESGENNGGVVVAVLLMAILIGFSMFSVVSLFASATESSLSESKQVRLTRLLSGSSNIGNGIVHALLIAYIAAHRRDTSAYWSKERALGGIEGPALLFIFNTIVGFGAIKGNWLRLSVTWNSFIAVSGSLLPVVWPRFLDEGLSTWPYAVIFIWFVIFLMELSAFASSWCWYAIAFASKQRPKCE